MSTMATKTALPADSYLRSLALDSAPQLALKLDGGWLYRIADDHFVIIACAAHGHRGPAYLTRVLPPTWECFHVGVNPDEGWEAHHYGPEVGF